LTPEELAMQAQIIELRGRVESIETTQKTHMDQTNSIKSDTAELLETFQALKGAWTVLNWIGKLAKPIGIIAAFFGTWYAMKPGGK